MLLLLSDVVDLVAVTANIALVISLFFLVYQIALQRREMKYSIYERLMSDFSDASFLLVEHPELLGTIYVGEGSPINWKKYDENQKLLYSYLDGLLALFERVWIACDEIKLPKEVWQQWKIWVKELVLNDVFLDVVNDNQEHYDSSFINEIQRIINEVTKKESPPPYQAR